MTEHEASRTLVKSPPELWAECSDAASLARHLDRFGEIRITRLDPETAVAWEGERARGTVRIEPAGWGTRVTLTAVTAEEPGPAVVSAADEPGPAVASAADQPGPAMVSVTEAPGPTAVSAADEAGAARGRVPQPPEPAEVADQASSEASPTPRRKFARLRALFRARPADLDVGLAEAPDREAGSTEVPVPEAGLAEVPAPEPSIPEPVPEPPLPNAIQATLSEALDSLGRAHHRPYSRA